MRSSTDPRPEGFGPLKKVEPPAPKQPEPKWTPAQTPGYEKSDSGEIRKKGTS